MAQSRARVLLANAKQRFLNLFVNAFPDLNGKPQIVEFFRERQPPELRIAENAELSNIELRRSLSHSGGMYSKEHYRCYRASAVGNALTALWYGKSDIIFFA